MDADGLTYLCNIVDSKSALHMNIKLRCTVQSITFSNPDNGWAVLKTKADGHRGSVTVTGTLGMVAVGSVLEVSGEWRTDARFGTQFAAEDYSELMPATVAGIEKYLGSGLIPGIGKRYARMVTKHFGIDTIDIIENNPERLSEVPRLGKKQIELLTQGMARHRQMRDVMLFLQTYGLSCSYSAKIYNAYGENCIDLIKDNPYRLADDVEGVGFKGADSLAIRLGISEVSPFRCRSGVMYVLKEMMDDGHVYATPQQLCSRTVRLLGVDESDVQSVLSQMVEAGDIVYDHNVYYLGGMYYAEHQAAVLLKHLMDYEATALRVPENEGDIEYDQIQQQAIRQAMHSNVMVLTGGPGTGKTTTVQGIIEAFEANGCTISLAAPTGRAAKRLSEAAGMEAKTIHRLLEYSPVDGFGCNNENQLDTDVVIVDESSMIDILLFYRLLDALAPGTRLVLVGDTDQLPSVGAGNVLLDIIDSGVVPVVRLTRIFRQAQASRIITNAHAINHGQFPDISNAPQDDFFFMPIPDDSIPQTIVELVKTRLPKAYSLEPHQIQVLTPMQRGAVGAVALNATLQQALNPYGEQLTRGLTVFRTRDKVMQIRNNYDKGVFNGDIGYVSVVDTEENKLRVLYDGRSVEYDAADLDQLTLAYAITVHKSQGSEFKAVVMPVTMQHHMMLERNLIYTAITRARELCVLLGDTRAVSRAVGTHTVSRRNSLLNERLRLKKN